MKPAIGVQPVDVALVAAQLSWSTTLMFVPAYLMRIAGPDAWLSMLMAGGFGLAAVALATTIGARSGGPHLFALMDRAFGRWLGKLATVLLTLYFLLMAAADVQAVAEFFVGAALPHVPVPVLGVIVGLIAALAVRPGPAVLCRANSAVLVPALLVTATIPFALAGRMRPDYVFPLLGNGLVPVFQGAYPAAGWLAELIMLAVFLPLSSDRRQASRAAYIGFGVGFLALQVILVCSLLVFGSDMAGFMYKPADVLVTAMSLGAFGERVDMVLIAVWHPTAVLRVALALYAAVRGVGHLSGARDHRPLVLPLGATAVLLADWSWESLMLLYQFGRDPWPLFSLVTGLGLPALALLVYSLRRRFAHPAGGSVQGAPQR